MSPTDQSDKKKLTKEQKNNQVKLEITHQIVRSFGSQRQKRQKKPTLEKSLNLL